ncbi:MAG TPA: hypothetical protein VIZ65_11925 [Cellvibrionaceae bacterium]
MNSIRIAAIVVLYHPSASCIDTIASFYENIDVLLLHQNSPLEDDLRIQITQLFTDKCRWIGDTTNQGIAKALNQAANIADDLNCQLLLTMDQDSQFQNEHFAHFSIWAKCLYTKYPLLSPNHYLLGERSYTPRSYPLWVMTSGNILCTKTFKSIGGFDECLFIDGVDIEFCARLLQFHSMAVCHDICLIHHLGDSKAHSVGGVKSYTTHHSPIRHYYIFRNYLYIAQMPHCQHIKRILYRKLRKTLKHILLFESLKFAKLRMAWRGFSDYRKGITGPYSHSTLN